MWSEKKLGRASKDTKYNFSTRTRFYFRRHNEELNIATVVGNEVTSRRDTMHHDLPGAQGPAEANVSSDTDVNTQYSKSSSIPVFFSLPTASCV